jgi:diguanylate cyclase (GGDEF)-like protein
MTGRPANMRRPSSVMERELDPPRPAATAASPAQPTMSPPAQRVPPVETEVGTVSAPEPTQRDNDMAAAGVSLAEGLAKSFAADESVASELAVESASEGMSLGKIADLGDLKQLLVRGLDDLISEHQALRQKLQSAGQYVREMESDRKQLQVALSKARKNSMADELTDLPNRDMFMRQLEGEIGRAKRYGFAIALALIDLDDLEGINQRHGREVGDEVLRCYASQILSRFRAYDMVARYGEDEFAILFPNTQKDGAMCALEKARKATEDTYIHHGGKNIPLPSFSSVLTLYSPGEQPATLLKRADEALSHAKRTGQDRIVLALPTS